MLKELIKEIVQETGKDPEKTFDFLYQEDELEKLEEIKER